MYRNKYGARKTNAFGITFDSQREANRYAELLILQRAGQIQNLELQKEFVLIPAQKINGKTAERAVLYRADFTYTENGNTVVEDVKGFRTKDYILKRKLMLWVHGIRIKEI